MSQDGDGLSIEEPELKFCPSPIKLRRTQNLAIEENLKPLSAFNKKRLAQEIYYGNATGQSPLTRSPEEHKPPVHQRLGNRQKTLRRTPRNVPNNLLVPSPRLRLRRTNTNTGPNGIQSVRRNSFKRTNSVQQRLYRIRQQHMMQTPQLRTKLFRHRMLASRPTNFTVEVDNTNFRKQPVPVLSHSVHGSLNEQLQSAIEMIQNQSSFSHELIAAEPIFVPGHGFTGIFINDRFSRLP